MAVFAALFVILSCVARLQGRAAGTDVDPDSPWTESDIISEEHVNAEEAPNVHYLFGDIRVTPEQQQELELDAAAAMAPETPPTSVDKRAVVKTSFALWPNGEVPYVLSSTLSSKARSAIRSAIATYRRETCIRFVPRKKQSDYVRFFRENGCWSYVGRIGGKQEVSIGSGCEWEGIVLHELLHVLGRWHEQSRPDRDRYIKVNYKNIEPGTESNFGKASSRVASTQGIPYDFKSIMHYDAWAFSKNRRPTIEPLDRSVGLDSLGQRSDFSGKDLRHINALYCANAASSGTWGSWSSWSSCSRTCNTGQRSRTRTCNGGSGCPGDSYQSKSCNTNSCADVEARWSEWTQWSSCSVTCGNGRRTRTRRCQNGDSCSGDSTQFKDCNPGSCSTGLNHLGCYQVVTTSSSLRLLEGTTSELRNSPFFRRDAVNKCARAAIKKNFNKFGVAYGYCISGSSNTQDYTEGGGSNVCFGTGNGGWSLTGGYSMDVYVITDSSAIPSADMPLNSPALAGSVEAEGYTDSELMSLEALSEDKPTETAGSSSAATRDCRYSPVFLAPMILITFLMSVFL